MVKTRSKPGSATTAPPKAAKATLKTLDAPVENPPQLVVLPKDAFPEARIVTIDSSRYFICPTKGFYEFTRISAPKATPRSWLLAPDRSSSTTPSAEQEEEEENGYVLSNPSLLLATPIDPLFLLLPSLAEDITSSSTEYLAPSDYLSKLANSSPHLSQILHAGSLPHILSNRIEAVSDCMDMGDDEKMYALSLPKLVEEIVQKARRMAAKPLPKSMEERFVKSAMDVPVLSIRREESGLSVHGNEGQATVEGATETETESLSTSKEEGESQDSTTSVETAATSISSTTSTPEDQKDQEIAHLLRLRTSLDFLLKSYIPQTLHPLLSPLFSKSIDFSPLTAHLARIAALKKEAQALRSIGENFSRKRALGEEDEGREEIKKRKKEEEEKKKRGVSQGVRKLAKVDRSGMKSLASFFGKK